MEVHVKGSPTIEVGFEKVVKVEVLDSSPFEQGDAENSAVLKGGDNVASSERAVAMGEGTSAEGLSSVGQGYHSKATGRYSHAEGNLSEASGNSSHAEGQENISSGQSSHAEGRGTESIGQSSHSEGYKAKAVGGYSHAEGYATESNEGYSHAEGSQTKANGSYSHAEGRGTETTNAGEHAEGWYNKSNTGDEDYQRTIHGVGCGTSDSQRKNAHEIMRDGKHYVFGIGGYDGTNPSESKDLATVVNTGYRVFGMTPEWDTAIESKPDKTHHIVIESTHPLTKDDVIDFARYVTFNSRVGHYDKGKGGIIQQRRKWSRCTMISTHPRGGQPNNSDYSMFEVQLLLKEIGSPNEHRSTYWYQLYWDEYPLSVWDFIGGGGFFCSMAEFHIKLRWGKKCKKIRKDGNTVFVDAAFIINDILVPFTMNSTWVPSAEDTACYIINGA